MEKMYIVVLNFNTNEVDTMVITDKPAGVDVEDYIKDHYGYSLYNCHHMCFYGKPKFNLIKVPVMEENYSVY
jgi:hypothetical protein